MWLTSDAQDFEAGGGAGLKYKITTAMSSVREEGNLLFQARMACATRNFAAMDRALAADTIFTTSKFVRTSQTWNINVQM